jgi:hypothetical protein
VKEETSEYGVQCIQNFRSTASVSSVVTDCPPPTVTQPHGRQSIGRGRQKPPAAVRAAYFMIVLRSGYCIMIIMRDDIMAAVYDHGSMAAAVTVRIPLQ